MVRFKLSTNTPRRWLLGASLAASVLVSGTFAQLAMAQIFKCTATDGSVAYLFNKQGVINFAPGADEEQIMDIVLEVGAEDIEAEEDGAVSVTTSWETLGRVVQALKAASLEPDHADVTMVPSTTSPCDEAQAEKLLRLIDTLEELDDVQNVYSNGEIPDSAYDA